MARKLDRLSQTLDKLLKARGFQGRLHEYRIFGHWERTVGPGIARHARPQQVRGSKLSIIVDSPAWMQQLSLLKPEIIAKLNDRLGREAIKDISLKLGEIEASHEQPDEAETALPPLDPAEEAKIDAIVEEISDEATRETVRRVIEKDFQSKKKKK